MYPEPSNSAIEVLLIMSNSDLDIFIVIATIISICDPRGAKSDLMPLLLTFNQMIPRIIMLLSWFASEHIMVNVSPQRLFFIRNMTLRRCYVVSCGLHGNTGYAYNIQVEAGARDELKLQRGELRTVCLRSIAPRI
jgi:hypothetical protein